MCLRSRVDEQEVLAQSERKKKHPIRLKRMGCFYVQRRVAYSASSVGADADERAKSVKHEKQEPLCVLIFLSGIFLRGSNQFDLLVIKGAYSSKRGPPPHPA